MSVTAHYEDTDLALFAMQLLESEEHRAVASHVGSCAFCRQELARLQGDLATCAYGVEMYAPAAAVRERVMRHAAREKKTAPVEERPRAARFEAAEQVTDLQDFQDRQESQEPELEFRRHAPEGRTARRASTPQREDRGRVGREPRGGSPLRGVSLWLGWALAAGLAVAAVNLYRQQESDRGRLTQMSAEAARWKEKAAGSQDLFQLMASTSARQVLLSGTAAVGELTPEGHVIYSADQAALIFLGEHLAALEPGKVYELWLIPEDGQDPVPAGTFHPDERGNGRVILPPLPGAVPAKAFGVTIEEGAGSRSPTMPIVLAGS